MATRYRYVVRLPTLLANVLGKTFGVEIPTKTWQRRACIQELDRWRAIWKRHLLYRDVNIRQIIAPKSSTLTQDSSASSQRIGIIADLDTRPLLSAWIAALLSSCSPLLLAELREWQRAALVIACIDTAISYITAAPPEDVDPLADRICDAMTTTILVMLPPDDLLPAQPRPDDRERAMDRRVFSDEPQMQGLLFSLDEPNRRFFESVANRERARLPLFPTHFRAWNPEGHSVDGSASSFPHDYKNDTDMTKAASSHETTKFRDQEEAFIC